MSRAAGRVARLVVGAGGGARAASRAEGQRGITAACTAAAARAGRLSGRDGDPVVGEARRPGCAAARGRDQASFARERRIACPGGEAVARGSTAHGGARRVAGAREERGEGGLRWPAQIALLVPAEGGAAHAARPLTIGSQLHRRGGGRTAVPTSALGCRSASQREYRYRSNEVRVLLHTKTPRRLMLAGGVSLCATPPRPADTISSGRARSGLACLAGAAWSGNCRIRPSAPALALRAWRGRSAR